MDGDKGFVLRPPCEGRGVPRAPFTAPLMGLVSRVQQRAGARIRDLLTFSLMTLFINSEVGMRYESR